MQRNPKAANPAKPRPTLSRLYRYFDDKAHAERLCDGHVWLSTLDWLRTSNDHRAESGESTVTYSVCNFVSERDVRETNSVNGALSTMGINVAPGGRIAWHGAAGSINIVSRPSDAFVFCTSTSKRTDYLSRVYGKHCVAIDNPEQFFDLVGNAVEAMFGKTYRHCGPIDYSGRKFYQGDTGRTWAPFVGPTSNSVEKEFRFLFSPKTDTALERTELIVPAISAFCSMV